MRAQEPSAETSSARLPSSDVRIPLCRWLNVETFILLFIFILFYFFRLAAFSISIDDEFGAVRDSPDVWLVQGRWTLYLFERYVISQQVLPVFPFLVFGGCVALSYRLLLRAFGIERLGKIDYLAFTLYVAYPIWIFSLSFFSNTMAFGLGQLLAVAAVCNIGTVLSLHNAGSARQRLVLPMVRACLFGAAAIGMYQSFVFSVASLSLGLIVADTLRTNAGWRATLVRCAWAGAGVISCVVVYECMQSVLLAVTHLGGERYVGNFLNWDALRTNPWHVVAAVIVNGLQTYGGSAAVFGTTLASYAIIVVLGFFAILLWPSRSWRSRLIALLLTALLSALPFLLHVASGGNLPARTLVAVPAVMWLLARLGSASPRRFVAFAMMCAVMVGAVQSLYALNLLQTANEFARKHDEALAVAIVGRVVAIDPHIADGPAPVLDFYGAQPFDSIYPRPIPATLGYSFFEWDGGNSYRIVTYLHLLGYTRFDVASQTQRRQNDVVFREMPSWPAPDSVRIFNGVILVKLGPNPGFR
jgi:hypothetical protein